MLAGDCNSQAQCCDSRCTEWRDATYWEGSLDEHGLVIGNDDRPTHYWTRPDSKAQCVIHLTVANRPFGTWFILNRIHPTGSNY